MSLVALPCHPLRLRLNVCIIDCLTPICTPSSPPGTAVNDLEMIVKTTTSTSESFSSGEETYTLYKVLTVIYFSIYVREK